MQPKRAIDVIIPALNEQASIALVLGSLPQVRTVFVVDNGSTDRTAEIAEVYDAVVLTEPQRGYGAACLRGLREIYERTTAGALPPDIVAFIDADFSDHPEYLNELVRQITEEKYDFALGSRLLGEREKGAMPVQSIMGNKLACFLMKLFFGGKYTDLGPFRAIKYSALQHLEMNDQNFGWTIEMQIKAVRAGLKIVEVPVPYRIRIGTSKISGTLSGSVKAGVKILYTIAKYGIKSWNLKRLSESELLPNVSVLQNPGTEQVG